jgi:hypothetical protein
MRKQDIKTGVVYAYQRGRGDYDSPEPIVFLAAPADGKLYTERDSFSQKGISFHRARPGGKPVARRSYMGGSTGYPAVLLDHGTDPADLLRVTLADFEAATTAYPGNIKFVVFVTLAHITGPYDEQVAEYEGRRAARDDASARQEQARRASRDRAKGITAALKAAGIEAEADNAYGTVTSIVIPLDEAEKLIALLEG